MDSDMPRLDAQTFPPSLLPFLPPFPLPSCPPSSSATIAFSNSNVDVDVNDCVLQERSVSRKMIAVFPQRVEQKSDELQAYETLPDELKPFCPKYFGEGRGGRRGSWRDGKETTDKDAADEAFLMLQNLVYGMKNPHVMDIKVLASPGVAGACDVREDGDEDLPGDGGSEREAKDGPFSQDGEGQ
eukprot:714785-Hanusia_phi.AAC.4